MEELKMYVQIKDHNHNFEWRGKWHWFNDLSHARNYARVLRRKGIEVELLDENKVLVDL